MGLQLVYDETNPRGFAACILMLVMLSISWPVVIARFVARGLIRSIGLDDWTIIPAQLCYTGFIIASLYFYQAVPGAQAASMEKAKEATTWIVVQQATFPSCTLFWKLSLGFFFLRIVVMQKLKMMVHIVITVSTVVNAFVVFWCLFMCGNPRDYFVNTVAGKCISKQIQEPAIYIYCSINALTDLAFATLPFFLLHRSKLPRRTKNYVLGVLVFATISVGASFARMWYVGNLLKSKESFVGFSAVNIVTVLELGTGIVASSVVTLRPLQNLGDSIKKFRSSIYPREVTAISSLDSEKPTGKSEVEESRGMSRDDTLYPEDPITVPVRNYSKPYAFT